MRSSKQELWEDYNSLLRNNEVNLFINTTPSIILILNQNRQIVYLNDIALNFFKIKNVDSIIGLKPGEAVYCVHASKTDKGCGESIHCKDCGLGLSFINTLNENKTDRRETDIIQQSGSMLEMRVWSTPLRRKNHYFIIAALSDISIERKKRELEKIFFHDILNTAGSLRNFCTLFDEVDDNEKTDILDTIKRISNELVEEIQYQRILNDSENREFRVDVKEFLFNSLVQSVVESFIEKGVFEKHNIIFEKNDEVWIESDHVLMRRIIHNLVKNAIEASSNNEAIRISIYRDGFKINFSIANSAVISPDIKKRIFTKSSSTKGEYHGLGTYSVKLLTEKYLHGKVHFKSNRKTGTIFYLQFPMLFRNRNNFS
ncbi:MAG: HAMP domain-containing histidine kinase [Melioribacteraceae bacterium]|nr:HAMP domain-containing histidine kinase [Melioribacteraceae bacterium]